MTPLTDEDAEALVRCDCCGSGVEGKEWNRRATREALAKAPEVAALLAEALLAQRSQIEADHAALLREAEARVMRIAASLFPGGYDNNFAKITAAAKHREGK